jgi:hypothetical protein
MDLIRSLSGSGVIGVGSAGKRRTRYAIGVWRQPDGRTSAKGVISGDADTIFDAWLSPQPIPLTLSDGRNIRVTVTERGNEFAEVRAADLELAC